MPIIVKPNNEPALNKLNLTAVRSVRSRRDIEIAAGDEFTLNLNVYQDDKPAAMPLEMEGSTLVFQAFNDVPRSEYGNLINRKSPIFTISANTGENNLFEFESSYTHDMQGRYRFAIIETTSGQTRTLVNGALTVY